MVTKKKVIVRYIKLHKKARLQLKMVVDYKKYHPQEQQSFPLLVILE